MAFVIPALYSYASRMNVYRPRMSCDNPRVVGEEMTLDNQMKQLAFHQSAIIFNMIDTLNRRHSFHDGRRVQLWQHTVGHRSHKGVQPNTDNTLSTSPHTLCVPTAKLYCC